MIDMKWSLRAVCRYLPSVWTGVIVPGLLPLSIAFGGWYVSKATSSADINQRYVAVAIDVLRDRTAAADLRDWAIGVIMDADSHYVFDTALAKKLATGQITLPAAPVDILRLPNVLADPNALGR